MIRKKENKIRLTNDEEFQIFKIVVDKYLWIGTIALIYGVYLLLNRAAEPSLGLLITLVGATILLMFTAIMIRHFDFKKV